MSTQDKEAFFIFMIYEVTEVTLSNYHVLFIYKISFTMSCYHGWQGHI